MTTDVAFASLSFNEYHPLPERSKEAAIRIAAYGEKQNHAALLYNIVSTVNFQIRGSKTREGKIEMAGPKACSKAEPAIWKQPDGTVMSCEESILVLRENLGEIEEICQEALEDAVLMDVSEAQFREVLHAVVEKLTNPYKEGLTSDQIA